MILVEIAAYILFITLIMFYSTRVLWLFFLLFSYRFWESLLSVEKLSKFISFSQPRDYYIVIIIITVLFYFIVLAASQAVPALQYILLIVIALYVLKQPEYGIRDVLVFKDYLEAKGMWSMDYWVQQIKGLFTSEDSIIMDVFKNIFHTILDFFKRLQGYIQEL